MSTNNTQAQPSCCGSTICDPDCSDIFDFAGTIADIKITVAGFVAYDGSHAVQVLDIEAGTNDPPSGNWTLGDWTGDVGDVPMPTGWTVTGGTLLGGGPLTVTANATGSQVALTWDTTFLIGADANPWFGSVVQDSFVDGTDPDTADSIRNGTFTLAPNPDAGACQWKYDEGSLDDNGNHGTRVTYFFNITKAGDLYTLHLQSVGYGTGEGSNRYDWSTVPSCRLPRSSTEMIDMTGFPGAAPAGVTAFVDKA